MPARRLEAAGNPRAQDTPVQRRRAQVVPPAHEATGDRIRRREPPVALAEGEVIAPRHADDVHVRILAPATETASPRIR